jgi:hypothetical protein
VSLWSGRVRACDGQALRWVTVSELESVTLLPADGPIVDAVVARVGQD